MSRNNIVIIGSFLLVLINFLPTEAAPKCERSLEDCHDRAMHPDLPSELHLKTASNEEKNSEFWLKKGEDFIKNQLNSNLNKKKAKNVIMFLGDGMGVTTIAAARNLLGGEEKQLFFERFPYTGLAKTYSVDKTVPDSACTATAYLCGVKAIEGTIGVNGYVDREDCTAMQDVKNHVYSIAKWAMDAGKSAGLVTTTRVTHASPAGVYAHIADRDWEDDNEVSKVCGERSGVDDIAYQLIHNDVGSELKLVLGGGKRHFIDKDLYENGQRIDGENLIETFKNSNPNNVYVETREELMNVDLSKAERILGLFQDNHLLYHLETNEKTNQPTLEEMTRRAIDYLSQNDEGYFIFIEGGRIDLAHHDNMARIALDETIEFSKAIETARNMTNEDDTLIIVTADHSHAFSYAGYPYRGNDIFGRTPATPDDKVPYMTLSYANGPSYEKFYDAKNLVRVDPTNEITGDIYDVFPASAPLDSETHGGDDVAVYASGPWAHLFTGAYEQNTIPHIMGYASCLGSGLKMCDSN